MTGNKKEVKEVEERRPTKDDPGAGSVFYFILIIWILSNLKIPKIKP